MSEAGWFDLVTNGADVNGCAIWRDEVGMCDRRPGLTLASPARFG